jgi:hypothetical protein
MIVASITQSVRMPRFGVSCVAAPDMGQMRLRRLANKLPSVRVWPVSMSTTTLIPARSGGALSFVSILSRTGRRCTTFTQLPDEFCAGSTANCAPVAGLIVATLAFHSAPG